MSIVNKGFHGRRDQVTTALPPGQHLTSDFPVLQAGPTPRIDLDRWRFTIGTELGTGHTWTWAQLTALPSERPVVDIHCVTSWSKLDTRWEGVSLDTLFASVDTAADFALVHSYGGSSTATTANRSARPTAGRPGCWCPICTSGSPRSG